MAMYSFRLWSLLSLSVSVTAKPNACPILGPAFPAPTEIGRHPTFIAATQNLTAQVQQAIESGELAGNSISVQIFSGSDSYTAYGLSHTDDLVRNGSVGVREVDENTIFRIGSISKLWTMLLYMTFNGTRHFQEPVSKYVPELRSPYNNSQQIDQIGYVNWDEVTIGELASHQAGIPRDCELQFFGLVYLCTDCITQMLSWIWQEAPLPRLLLEWACRHSPSQSRCHAGMPRFHHATDNVGRSTR